MRSDESASTRLEEITQEDTGHFSFKNTPLPGTKPRVYIYIQEDTGHFSFKNTPLPGTKLSIYIYIQEDTGHFYFKNALLPDTKPSIYIYTGGYRTLLLQECTPSRY